MALLSYQDYFVINRVAQSLLTTTMLSRHERSSPLSKILFRFHVAEPKTRCRGVEYVVYTPAVFTIST